MASLSVWEGKVVSTLGFILHLLLVALPLDILRWLRLRRKCVNGKVVVITGAGSGLGQRMAEIFALELKAKVAVLDIVEAAANAVAHDIREKGGTAESWCCDVADSESMNSTAAQVRKCLGVVDIVVCNAGILHFAHTLNLKTEDIQRAMNVNVMGPMNTIRAFLGKMEATNSGQIVGISSIAGYFGETYGMAYCPTKFAVRGIMECLRMEMRDRKLDGIVCTTVCPYFVRTPMILSKGMRPTSRLVSFMSIERCTRQIIDAILKEKAVAFVPSWISIMPMVTGLLSVNMFKACRDYLNCRYEPFGNSATTITQENCGRCGKKIIPKTDDDLLRVNDEREYGKSINNNEKIICCCSRLATDKITNDVDAVKRSTIDNNNRNENSDTIVSPRDRSRVLDSNVRQFELYTMENYFRPPNILWFFIIPPALALTFLVWYTPETFNIWQLGYIGGQLHHLGTEHNEALYWLNVCAWIAHFVEAQYALFLSNELGLSHTCALKWFIQTFIFGYPSLRILLERRKRKTISKSK